MFKNFLIKTTLLSSFLAMSLMAFSSKAGLAATFLLQQEDDFGEVALSGQFTGEDTDSSSSLTLDELSSFDLNVYGQPLYTLSDFTSFFYSLDGSNSINFNAAKVENINDGDILYIEYNLSVDSESPDLITSGGDTTYFANGDIVVSDIFLSQPIQITPTSVPEGDHVMALGFLGLFFLLQQGIKTLSNHQN